MKSLVYSPFYTYGVLSLLLSFQVFSENSHTSSSRPISPPSQTTIPCLDNFKFMEQYGPSQPLLSTVNPRKIPNSIRPTEDWGHYNRTYPSSGRGGVGGYSPKPYDTFISDGKVYNSPPDSNFRRSMADAFLCSLANNEANFNSLNWYLSQNDLHLNTYTKKGDQIPSEFENGCSSLANQQANRRAINREMVKIFSDLKKLQKENQDSQEIVDFLYSVFNQTKTNEISLTDKKQPLELMKPLKDQVDKIISLKRKDKESLTPKEDRFLKFFDEFTQGANKFRFQYLVHPVIGELITHAVETQNSPTDLGDSNHLEAARVKVAENLKINPNDLKADHALLAGAIKDSPIDEVTPVIAWAYKHFLKREDDGVSDPGRQVWIDNVKQGKMNLWDAVKEISKSDEARNLYATRTFNSGILQAYNLLYGKPPAGKVWTVNSDIENRAIRGGNSELIKIAEEIFNLPGAKKNRCDNIAARVTIPEDVAFRRSIEAMNRLENEEKDNPKQGKEGTPFRDARNDLLKTLIEHAPHGLWNTPEGSRLKRIVQSARQQEESLNRSVDPTIETFTKVNPELKEWVGASTDFSKSFNIPYRLEKAEQLSQLDPVYSDLLKHLSKKTAEVTLNSDQKEALKEFLEEGKLDKFVEAVFNEKNTSLFKSTAEFISKGSPEFNNLFKSMVKFSHLPQKDAREYSDLRASLRERFAKKKLEDLNPEEKKKLLGLMLLDEWGLKGVTSRDKQNRQSGDYDINNYLAELKRENETIVKICGSDEACKQRTDLELLKTAKDFIGHYTGIPPHLRQVLLERKLAEPHLAELDKIFQAEEITDAIRVQYRKVIEKLTAIVGSREKVEALSSTPNSYLNQVRGLYDVNDPKRQQYYFFPVTNGKEGALNHIQTQIPGRSKRAELNLKTEEEFKKYEEELKRYASMLPQQQEQVKAALETQKKQREINYQLISDLNLVPKALNALRESREGNDKEGMRKLLTALTLISSNTHSDLGVNLAAYSSYKKDRSERDSLVKPIKAEVYRLLKENGLLGNNENAESFTLTKELLDKMFESNNIDTQNQRAAFQDQEKKYEELISQLAEKLNIPKDRISRLVAIQDDVIRAQEAQALPLSLSRDLKSSKEGFEAALLNRLQKERISPELRAKLIPEIKVSPATEELKKTIGELREKGLDYEPLHNELTLQPRAELDKKSIVELLKKLPPVAMRIQVEGGREITLPRQDAVKAFETALLRRAALYGVSVLDSKFDFGTGQFNNQGSADKSKHQWFPLSNETAARIMMKVVADGKPELSYELKPMKQIREELKQGLASIIQLREAIKRNDKDMKSLKSAWDLISGEFSSPILSLFVDKEVIDEALNSNNSPDKREADRIDRQLRNLENFIKGHGSIPIPGSEQTSSDFANQDLRSLRSRTLQDQNRALDEQTRNVLNIRDGILMVATLPLGGAVGTLGKTGKIAIALNKTVFTLGRGGAVTLNSLRAVKGLEALAKTGNLATRLGAKSSLALLRSVAMIPAANRHGLIVAGTFQGIKAGVGVTVEGWKIKYGEDYIQSRLEEAKKDPLGWKKHKVHPGILQKFKNKDSNPELKKEYEEAVHQFNIEQELDVNGDGYIDMLREETRDLNYTDDIGTRLSSRVFNGDELNSFLGSAQFFANLHFLGHGTGAIGSRLIGGKPLVEMPLAATLSNLQNYLGRPQAWKEKTEAFEEKRKREMGDRYQPLSAAAQFWSILGEDAKENAISGAVFSTAIGVNNKIMGGLGLKGSGLGKQLFGTGSFMATDLALKEAEHWARHGKSQFSGMTNERIGESLLDHLSTAAYIGWGSSRGYLDRAQLKSQQESLMKNGMDKYRESARKEFEKSHQGKELEESIDYHIEGLMRSFEAHQYKEASPEFIKEFTQWREKKVQASLKALKELQASTQGTPVVNEPLKKIELNLLDLQKLLNEGAWNKVTELRKTIDEIDLQSEKIGSHIEKEREELAALEKRRMNKLRSGDVVTEAENKAIQDKDLKVTLLSQQLMEATRAMTHMKEFSGSIERSAAVLGQDPIGFKKLFETEGIDLSKAQKAIEEQRKRPDVKNSVIRWLSENGVADLTRDSSGQSGAGRGIVNSPVGKGAANFPVVHREAVDMVVKAYRAQSSNNSIEKQQLILVLEKLAPLEAVKLAKEEVKGATGDLKTVLEGFIEKHP